MFKILKNINWLVKAQRIKVFALVGKSGTGKSFRAKLLADKYNIDLIIDDGLLIKKNKILAGKSAKRENAYLGAIKTALFEDRQHRNELKKILYSEKFKKLLILGTSEKMVKKIAHRLSLPHIFKIIKIEDIASEEDIKKAVKTRHREGKHVIPVPALEIKRAYPAIFYDSIKVFLKRKFLSSKHKVFEKAVVRPTFQKKGGISISEPALTQMVLHCTDEFDDAIKISKVTVKEGQKGYNLDIYVQVPFKTGFSGDMYDLRNYIMESLERYTGILINSINIIVDKVVNK